jgi:hypothetical protein
MSGILYDIDKFELQTHDPERWRDIARFFGECNEAWVPKMGRVLQSLRAKGKAIFLSSNRDYGLI